MAHINWELWRRVHIHSSLFARTERRHTLPDNAIIDIPSSFLCYNNFFKLIFLIITFTTELIFFAVVRKTTWNWICYRTLWFLSYTNGWSWMLTKRSTSSHQMFGVQHPRGAKPQHSALIYTFVRARRVFRAYITHSSVQHASRVTV